MKGGVESVSDWEGVAGKSSNNGVLTIKLVVAH